MLHRFMADCELCEELLADYISAGNEIVDTKVGLEFRKEPTAHQLAAAMLNHALKHQDQARQRLFLHKRQHH